jgi:phosphatidylglycerol:prolipoprotein diacylglycerol transferase
MLETWLNPNLISLGPVHIRWHAALYVLGFLIGAFILRNLARKKIWPLPLKTTDQLVTYMLLGMLLGSRLTYVFLYNWEFYSKNLSKIFMIWNGGLSFYGSLLGLVLVTLVFARKHQVHFFQLSDCLAVALTPAIFLGRIGNFINGELYGKITDSWIGIVFPEGGPFPRHPSQLYEGFFEGLVLFAILFALLKRQRYHGEVTSAFLLGYGLFRFFIEFYREPEIPMGYFFTYLTLGQVLGLFLLPLSYMVFKQSQGIKLKNPLIQR